MVIPVCLEFCAIVLNVFQKEGMKKPDVVGVISIEGVEPLETGEEGPPATGKVATNFAPEPLNPGVTRRTANMGLFFNWEFESAGTYVPHMNEPRFGPRYIIIHVHRSMFSDPLSPRTRYGHPNSLMESRKRLRTVCAVLRVDTRMPGIW